MNGHHRELGMAAARQILLFGLPANRLHPVHAAC
jgi:hypothetical protein